MRHAPVVARSSRFQKSQPTRSFAARGTALLMLAMLAITGCGTDFTGPSGPNLDFLAPNVTSTNPLNGATGVAIITASFSESMGPASISNTTFLMTSPGGLPVSGSVSYNSATHIATFTPSTPLLANTAYSARITTGANDEAGNPLAADHIWTFTTSAVSGSQLSLALGGAAAYAVLAGATVTNTGATNLTGDLGVSPGAAVTGFPPGTLSGTIHAGDVASAAGMAGLTTAYNEAAGRTLAPVTVAGNIGGLTLPPGLYKSTSSLEITSGDLTLDAQGNANAVFLFQVASTLTTTSGRSVILSGGAKSANVFWQVGTSATLGTTTVFKGTIMANQSVTLNTGASLNGRALARIGSVSMVGNSIVMPTP